MRINEAIFEVLLDGGRMEKMTLYREVVRLIGHVDLPNYERMLDALIMDGQLAKRQLKLKSEYLMYGLICTL